MSQNYTTSILVDQGPEKVFKAINNVRGWRSEEVEGKTDVLNEVREYHYQDVHRCTMKITELVANERIVWTVLDNHFSFTKDKQERKGNQIIFEITKKGDQTQLQFTQLGLVPEYECFDICQNARDTYIHKSLYNLITTGTGQPNGKDNAQTEDEKKLSAPDFTTTFFVDQTPYEVFNAINNVSGRWQGEVVGESQKLDDEFSYRMSPYHYSNQKVIEFIPNEKVVWLVTDSELASAGGKGERTNTKIIFEITEINKKTQVRFTHAGLIPEFECYNSCENAWTKLIQESLYSLITTGKGTKVF